MSELDFTQLGTLSKPELQAKIISLGADYHQVETKRDLIGRIMQLSGTAQPIDQLKKAMEEAGVGAEDGQPSAPAHASKKVTHRLTKQQIVKTLKPFMEKGLKVRLTNEGHNVEFEFRTKQSTQAGRIIDTVRRDCLNTLIPIEQLKRSAQECTTVRIYKTKEAEDMGDEGLLTLDDAMDPDAEELTA